MAFKGTVTLQLTGVRSSDSIARLLSASCAEGSSPGRAEQEKPARASILQPERRRLGRRQCGETSARSGSYTSLGLQRAVAAILFSRLGSSPTMEGILGKSLQRFPLPG